MSRAVAALWLALTLCGARASADGGDFAHVMQLLGRHPHRRAHFTERQDLAILDRPLESAGDLIYDAPDRLEERLSRPRRERLIATGRELTVERNGRRRTVELDRTPQIAALIDSIRATLAGDSAALSRSFTVQFSGDVARWTLRLAPRSAALARQVAAIRIDGARDALLHVEIRQADGDRSSMRIEDETR